MNDNKLCLQELTNDSSTFIVYNLIEKKIDWELKGYDQVLFEADDITNDEPVMFGKR